MKEITIEEFFSNIEANHDKGVIYSTPSDKVDKSQLSFNEYVKSIPIGEWFNKTQAENALGIKRDVFALMLQAYCDNNGYNLIRLKGRGCKIEEK